MKDLKQHDTTDGNKENFNSKISQKIMEITEDMPGNHEVKMVFYSHDKSITLSCNNKKWHIFINIRHFSKYIKDHKDHYQVTSHHYKSDNSDVFFVDYLRKDESDFFKDYVDKCAREATTLPDKEILKEYFKHFNEEYILFTYEKSGVPIKELLDQLGSTEEGDVEIFKNKIASFGKFVEETGKIIDEIKTQEQHDTINVTFNSVADDISKVIPYIKFKHKNYTHIIMPFDHKNSHVAKLLFEQYVTCNLCISHQNYTCKGDNAHVYFHYYEFGENLYDLDLTYKYLFKLKNLPGYLNSRDLNSEGRYRGNKKELLEYFNDSSRKFCQDNQRESITKENNNNYTTTAYGLFAITTSIPYIAANALGLISTKSNTDCTDVALVLNQRIANYEDEDNIPEINDYLLPILVSVGSAIATTAFGIACFICRRKKRELEALEEGNGQSQPEERERLSIQNGSEQQSDSDNEASEIQNDINDQQLVLNEESDHSSFVIDDEETPQISSRSNTPSRTGSSSSPRSGAVSQAGSSSSLEGEVITADSVNLPQGSPRTSMENVQDVERSQEPKAKSHSIHPNIH